MLAVDKDISYYFYSDPVDMRKSFNGLYNIACSQFPSELANGSAFIFQNKRKNCIKIFRWDGSGLVILHKKLRKGVFFFAKSDAKKVLINASQLALILSGIKV